MGFKKFAIVYALIAAVVGVFLITRILPKEAIQEIVKSQFNPKRDATPGASLKIASESASPAL